MSYKYEVTVREKVEYYREQTVTFELDRELTINEVKEEAGRRVQEQRWQKFDGMLERLQMASQVWQVTSGEVSTFLIESVPVHPTAGA